MTIFVRNNKDDDGGDDKDDDDNLSWNSRNRKVTAMNCITWGSFLIRTWNYFFPISRLVVGPSQASM
jgi:hypothetical protein